MEKNDCPYKVTNYNTSLFLKGVPGTLPCIGITAVLLR